MPSDLENGITVVSTAPAPSAETLGNVRDLASPFCVYNGNSCFKENINITKSETPKLSLEPLQMKRKKKGGGYNLRKSMAWDRAFFTEEGVLDPLELSIISDVSHREGLPVIGEDTPGGSQQDEDSDKDRKKDWSSLKLDSSSANLMTSTSQTSLPTHLGSKPGSRYGDCPRPLHSPSLKRPANVNVCKAAGKELKLPKVPGLKPGLGPTCATTRSTILRANRVKHNQITQPDFSVQRHAELKFSSKSLKNTQNVSGANSLQSANCSDGDSASLSLKRHSSINMSPLMVKADNSSQKMIPDNATSMRAYSSSVGQRYDSTTFAASCCRDSHISGRTLPPLQNITVKPSGLRMPSPSLSFFSQPKPSVFRNLPLKDTEFDVFGSQNCGTSRLQDNPSRTPKTYNRILESTINSSKARSSRSECRASSHLTAIESNKPKPEQKPIHMVEDLPKKNIIARISHEEAELQKIGIEVSSQSGSREQAMDNFFKKAIDGYPVKSESFGSGWRNVELGSKQNYAIQGSETISAIGEPPEGENTHNFLVLNDGYTQCSDALDDRVRNTLTMQIDWGKSTKPDCHEPHRDKIDPLKYPLGETDKDKNVLKQKERATEQLGVSQQSESCCSGSIKPLEQAQAKAENLYLGSKHLHSIEVLTDNLLAGQAHMQNSVFASTIGGCTKDINLVQVGDDVKQPGKGSEVQNICLKFEMESGQIDEPNASQRLSPEKQISLQNSHEKEKLEKLQFAVPDRKDEMKVNDTRMPISPSLGKRYDSNLGEEKIIAQPLTIVELDYVDNSLSSDSHNSLINSIFDCNDKHKSNGDVSLNGTAYENLSNCLRQDTQRIEIDNCPLPESRMCQLSRKDTLGKVTEEVSCMRGGSADDRLTSTISLKDSVYDVNYLRGLQDTGTVLVQSPDSNRLNDRCFKQSGCMALASDEFAAENLAYSNDHLHIKSPTDVCSEDNVLGSMEDSAVDQNEINLRKSPCFSSMELTLKHENCDDAYGTGASIGDAITDPSRAKPFPGTIKGEVSEVTNSSFSYLHHKLDDVKVAVAMPPNNEHGDGVKKGKSCSIVLPQNAIPFSDEWLAAIEAAGEDILTRKGGAVQNSPPDKSLPEPSPWSPVKRKHNQIGPFDCTKFTGPSDSN